MEFKGFGKTISGFIIRLGVLFMTDIEQEILRRWLRIDLHRIATKMGIKTSIYEVDEKLISETIRCLDYESLMSKEPFVNYIITIIGLMWEHIDHEKYDIKRMIIKVLSRIGYPTSAIICDNGYNKKEGSFSMMDSWLDEVTATLYQIKNEVTVGGRKYLLTNYQKQRL